MTGAVASLAYTAVICIVESVVMFVQFLACFLTHMCGGGGCSTWCVYYMPSHKQTVWLLSSFDVCNFCTVLVTHTCWRVLLVSPFVCVYILHLFRPCNDLGTRLC